MSPSSKTPAEATETGRRQMDASGSREGFRPVALPALAAACRITVPASVRAEDRPAAGRRGILEMVHEDAPLL